MRSEPQLGLPRTLARYLAREIVVYSLLGFVAITTVLVSQNMLRRLDDLIGVGFTWTDFRTALGGMAVMFIAYAAPISFLVGTLLALRRLGGDCELLAMQACGIGLTALLLPVLAIGATVSAATGYLMLEAEHRARQDIRNLLTTVAARGSLLEPGRFRSVGNRVIFVRERDRQNNLRGIMISAKSEKERPYVIFAERGRFDFDPEFSIIRILLESGDLHLEPHPTDPEPYQHLSFEKLSYEIDIRSLIASGYNPTRPKQMTLVALRAVLDRARDGDGLWDLDDKNPIHYELEIHRRFALPLAPMIFGMLAVALASPASRRSSSWILPVGILLAFSYYAFISFAGLLAEKGWIPPALAPWGPTAVFAILGLVLLRRVTTNTAR